MASRRAPKKDRTSFLIAAALHVVLIGGVMFWAWKTGKLEQARQAILQYVKGDKREQKDDTKPIQQRGSVQTKLPPINQGLPPSMGSGTRRAVAADAPAAVGGESFFQDTRAQVQGGGGGTSETPKPKEQVSLRPVAKPPPPPRPSFAPPVKTTIKQLLAERAKAVVATESVGTEQISRSGSSDAGAVVTKVAGASIVDGKFAVIRGLSDRYVTTTLNGGEIPSADPYRRAASLDLFPAQIIDKVVVAKTFAPNQQGAFTGGGIDIVTKSFPDKPFATVTLGGAYNTQATGNDRFLTYEGGSLDWLGMDDGSRALPGAVAGVGIPQPVFSTGRPTSPMYSERMAQANLLNDLTHAMGVTQFAPSEEAPPLDHSFFLAAGDTTHFLRRPLGLFGSLSYRREFRYYEDGLTARYAPSGTEVIQTQQFDDRLATDSVNWSGMATWTSQWADDHELGFCFFYNQNSLKSARAQVGTRESEPDRTFFTHRLIWVERNLQSFQFKGKDEFPSLGGARLDWLMALTDTSQEEPDTRFFNMVLQDEVYATGRNYLPDPQDPTRYFRTLQENNLNPKVDFTLPFRNWSADEGEIKAGWFHSVSDRTFAERQIFYRGDAPFNGDPNTYLTPDNLGYTARPGSGGSTLYTWNRYIASFDTTYTAASDISAGYLMLELPLVPGLRLVGGARVESTDLQVNSVSYIENAITGLRTNNTVLRQTDVLPAVGLVCTLRSNMNLRLNYSQTLARPSVRELAAYRSYDPILDIELDGNPLLQLASAENYDVRWEWFPRPGELLSVSFFHKAIQGPIERRFISLVGDLISYENRPSGEVSGIEFEARRNLDFLDVRLQGWSLGGNLSLIQSETPLTPNEYANKSQIVPGTEPTRPLYDQSPYILNLDLNYDNPGWGTSASLVFNLAGPRIAIASLTTEDVYEQPTPVLDFVLSQKLGRRTTLKVTAKNLLNPKFERTYGESGERVYSSFTRGMTFGVQLTHDF